MSDMQKDGGLARWSVWPVLFAAMQNGGFGEVVE